MHFHLVCLENPEAFEPECHVHTGERLHWFEVLDELPRYWEGRYYDEGRTEMKPIGKGPQTKSDGNL